MNKRISKLLTHSFSVLLFAFALAACLDQSPKEATKQAKTDATNELAVNKKNTSPNSADTSTSSDSSQFVSGVHYTQLSNPLEVDSTDGVEVIELFWYGCPHCNVTQPYVKRWEESKPAAAHLVRMPAPLRGLWSLHAQIFYTNQALGLEDKLHQATFNAFHKSKLKLTSLEDFIDYYGSNYGIDAEEYKKAFDSFSVSLKMKKAINKIQQAQINGVPAFVVAGKYLINAESAGSTANIFSVINYLVKKEMES